MKKLTIILVLILSINAQDILAVPFINGVADKYEEVSQRGTDTYFITASTRSSYNNDMITLRVKGSTAVRQIFAVAYHNGRSYVNTIWYGQSGTYYVNVGGRAYYFNF